MYKRRRVRKLRVMVVDSNADAEKFLQKPKFDVAIVYINYSKKSGSSGTLSVFCKDLETAHRIVVLPHNDNTIDLDHPYSRFPLLRFSTQLGTLINNLQIRLNAEIDWDKDNREDE